MLLSLLMEGTCRNLRPLFGSIIPSRELVFLSSRWRLRSSVLQGHQREDQKPSHASLGPSAVSKFGDRCWGLWRVPNGNTDSTDMLARLHIYLKALHVDTASKTLIGRTAARVPSDTALEPSWALCSLVSQGNEIHSQSREIKTYRWRRIGSSRKASASRSSNYNWRKKGSCWVYIEGRERNSKRYHFEN